MQISQKGLSLIKTFEGFRTTPYLDAVGIPTIGYGTTVYPDHRKVSMKDQPIGEEIATDYLMEHIKITSMAISSMVIRPLRQQQFDALISFAYNLGTEALRNSTLLKKVNIDPSNPAIRAEFMKWVHAGGKFLEGLKKRRQAEADLYFSS